MGSIFKFGVFALNTQTGTLTKGDEPVRLPTKEFEILHFLVLNNGRLVTKDEIMEEIWSDVFVGEDNVAQYISRLRKILDSGEQKLITTFSKRGYRFSADVEVTELRGFLRREIRLEVNHGGTERESSPGVESIAVLPLRSLAGSPDADYFGIGLTDALITQLSRTGLVLVRPTRAVMQYADSEMSPNEIAVELGVDFVLLGNFHKSETEILVSLQMLDSSRQNVVWAERFRSTLTDVFALQDQIAEKFVKSIRSKIPEEAFTALKRRYTENNDAFDEYMKGRFFLKKRNLRDLKTSLRHFEKAIDIDPDYALAHAASAEVYELLPLFDDLQPVDAYSRARTAVLRALAIDPNLPEAHALLGVYLMNHDWNWLGAEVSFKKALDIGTNFASGHLVYATMLLRAGRTLDAVIELKKARNLDPLSPIVNTWMAEAIRSLGQYEAAVMLLRETISMEPGYFPAYYHLAMTYLQNDRKADALKFSRKGCKLANDHSLSLSSKVQLDLMCGEPEIARKTLINLIAMRQNKYVSATNIASCFAAFKDKAKTLEWLEKALVEKDPYVTWIGVDREFEFLQATPEFQRIKKKIGLLMHKKQPV